MQTAFSGKEIQVLSVENKIYILMNKPAGYVCKAVADRNKTVFELLPAELQVLVQGAKRGERLHTVGRLDRDTTGLLLITNDGQFSHKLTAPEYSVSKQYQVTLETPVKLEEQKGYCARAADGILLAADKKAPEERAGAAVIKFLDKETATVNCVITVTEGKFHEVRRIFSALGNKVLKLKRIQMGALELGTELPEGSWRYLTEQELSRLM